MTPDEQAEWLVCAESPMYFIDRYCWIEDATAREWRRFDLWPAQARTLRTILNNLLTIILKARQLGMTWLVLSYALWLMLFRPSATVLLFSKRDDESINLLDVRLKGIYQRLPEWMKVRATVTDSKHEWRLSNGSTAYAFPTTGGDSYTATLAIVDEADLVPDLGKLLAAVKPTVDAGGQLVLLSRVDKDKPESEFKAIYRAAKEGANGWAPVFLPWHSRPERGVAWHEKIRREVLARTGALDELHEQYPENDAEALSGRTLAKRIPPEHLAACYVERRPIKPDGAPNIPGLKIYVAPETGKPGQEGQPGTPGRSYVIGVDPAEGNPTSDDSALCVLDEASGEQVAALAGKFEPSTLAAYADEIGHYYNDAGLMVERNNHGHAVLLWLREHSSLRRMDGHDDREGWLSNSRGKALMYSSVADNMRDRSVTVYDFATMTQLGSIDGSTLRAPEGQHDDRADSFALACVGRAGRPVAQSAPNMFYT